MSEHITCDRLVCGLDDTEHATAVMAAAAELAPRLGLRLQAVHSADPDRFLGGELRDAALGRGEALLDEVAYAVPRVDRVVGLGEPVALLRAALAEGGSLAVIGSRGRGPGHAVAFGSTSSGLVGTARCPVVVVPPRSGDDLARGPSAVVCGVDGSAGGQDALVAAARLAAELGSELVAVNVQAAIGDRHAGLDVVEAAVNRLAIDFPVRMRVELGDPAAALAAVAGQQHSAILVVGTRGHGPVRVAFASSVPSRLCASSPVPVVVVPDASRSPVGPYSRREVVPAGVAT